MSSIEHEELLASFRRAHELIESSSYEKALEYLEKCDNLASKFPELQLLYETRRLISLCKLLQGKSEEYAYERELAAEEIERLGYYDEAGEVYKELADLLLITGKTNLARKYYLSAESDFNRWAKSRKRDASPKEAWEAWALVCRGEAQVNKEERVLAFLSASQKFGQASLRSVTSSDFYKAKEFFLRGRIAILGGCGDASHFDEKSLKEAENLFEQAHLLDSSFLLSEPCAKILHGLRTLNESREKALELIEESRVLLKNLKNPELSRRLSDLLRSFPLAWDKRNMASFCKSVEEMLVI